MTEFVEANPPKCDGNAPSAALAGRWFAQNINATSNTISLQSKSRVPEMSDSGALGKLLPKAIKRRRNKQPGAEDEGPVRGRSTAPREVAESDGSSSIDIADDEDTSLISYNSDHES